MSRPFAVFTATRFRPGRAAWGLWHMAAHRRPLARTPGLRFWRLLGTGRGIGFSAVPNPTAWALFTVWEDAAAWEAFDGASPVMRQSRGRGEECYSLLLDPLSAHGRWAGREPFAGIEARRPEPEAPVVVLTRATLRAARAVRFWQQVPRVDGTLRGHPAVRLTFGVGEAPWVMQATVSVWRTAREMTDWAYRTPAHAETVRRTRDEGWYAEELFARFRLAGTRGSWHGRDPLAGEA